MLLWNNVQCLGKAVSEQVQWLLLITQKRRLKWEFFKAERCFFTSPSSFFSLQKFSIENQKELLTLVYKHSINVLVLKIMYNILPPYSGCIGHVALRPQLWIFTKTQIQQPFKVLLIMYLAVHSQSGLIQKLGEVWAQLSFKLLSPLSYTPTTLGWSLNLTDGLLW